MESMVSTITAIDSVDRSNTPKPYFKLDRRKKYNIGGFTRGVNGSIDEGHKGIILSEKNSTNTFILIYMKDIPNRVRTWGDRTLFNYLVSIGGVITATDVEALNKEEENYSLVTLDHT